MKSKIIAHMRENTGMSAAEAEAAISAVTGAITSVANADGQARINGFGTFKVKDMPAREVRNPRTGETVMSAARRKLTFKEAKGGN